VRSDLLSFRKAVTKKGNTVPVLLREGDPVLEQAELEAAGRVARLEVPHNDARGVIDLIIDNVNQLKDSQGLKAPAHLDSATTLFGGDGFLDSMALVTLVVAVEQAIEEKFGTNVSLADPGAMSQEHSPYRTIGALADYALQRLRAG
jgi:acyl carrier protein